MLLGNDGGDGRGPLMGDERGADHPAERGTPGSLPARAMTVLGRQGSPTLTLALPFSHVHVKADDAVPSVAELASLVARLARAIERFGSSDMAAGELAAIASAADALASGARADGEHARR
jgi:hypothetical protein